MKPLLVLSKNQNTYFIKRLIEEVGISSLDLFDPWKGEGVMGSYRHCLVRTSGVYGDDQDLRFLNTFKGSIINPPESLNIFRRKSTQYDFFQKQGIPHLPWFNLINSPVDELQKWISHRKEDRFIVKPDRGQGGRGVELLNKKDLVGWFLNKVEEGDPEYVAQTYFETSEYRVFFIDDETWTLRRDKAEGEVTANFFTFGQASMATLPVWANAEVKRAIALSRARYGAMDILLGSDKVVILEINMVPGIEQLEQVTGSNVMKCLVSKLGIFK